MANWADMDYEEIIKEQTASSVAEASSSSAITSSSVSGTSIGAAAAEHLAESANAKQQKVTPHPFILQAVSIVDNIRSCSAVVNQQNGKPITEMDIRILVTIINTLQIRGREYAMLQVFRLIYSRNQSNFVQIVGDDLKNMLFFVDPCKYMADIGAGDISISYVNHDDVWTLCVHSKSVGRISFDKKPRPKPKADADGWVTKGTREKVNVDPEPVAPQPKKIISRNDPDDRRGEKRVNSPKIPADRGRVSKEEREEMRRLAAEIRSRGPDGPTNITIEEHDDKSNNNSGSVNVGGRGRGRGGIRGRGRGHDDRSHARQFDISSRVTSVDQDDFNRELKRIEEESK